MMMGVVLGLVFIALGVWGLYDEYYYVADFFKGGLPLVLMAFGLLATLAGVTPFREEEKQDD